MPVAYGIQDLQDDGDLARLATNIKDGLSNGAILALIAIGYTLVYGIIELINFAHGDVFMIGTFVSFGFFGTIGLTDATGGDRRHLRAPRDAAAGDVRLRLAQRDDRARGLPAVARSAQARTADHRGRHVLHPSERRPAVARRPAPQRAGHPRLAGRALHGRRRRRSPTATSSPLLVTAPLVILLISFINNSRAGRAMRATAQDPEAARLQGINVDTTIALTFLLGGMMAGAAGLVYALYQTDAWFFQGFTAGLLAFTVGRARRHRQPARRRARRPDHRHHPADLRQPDRGGVDARRSCSRT